jgi:hypothetical protein
MPSTIVRSLVCAVTLLALSTMPAAAQTPLDKRVNFTFNVPVSVPGVTLPPGTYQFRLGNPFGGRNVVHVFDKDGMKLYATFLTIPVNLRQASDEPQVRMLERRGNLPHAIRAWWYPSDMTGFEAVYPREQAQQLADSMVEPMLTSRATAAALIESNSAASMPSTTDAIQ